MDGGRRRARMSARKLKSLLAGTAQEADEHLCAVLVSGKEEAGGVQAHERHAAERPAPRSRRFGRHPYRRTDVDDRAAAQERPLDGHVRERGDGQRRAEPDERPHGTVQVGEVPTPPALAARGPHVAGHGSATDVVRSVRRGSAHRRGRPGTGAPDRRGCRRRHRRFRRTARRTTTVAGPAVRAYFRPAGGGGVTLVV